MAPEGPALAVILGSTSHPSPCRAKDTLQNHMLPAPFWRGSIQKTIQGLGKAPQRHSQSPGVLWGSQTQLLLPPSTAKTWGRQGSHELSHSLQSIPVLMRWWQVLSSRIHLTARADPSSAVLLHRDEPHRRYLAATGCWHSPQCSVSSPCHHHHLCRCYQCSQFLSKELLALTLPTLHPPPHLSEHKEVTWTLSQRWGGSQVPSVPSWRGKERGPSPNTLIPGRGRTDFGSQPSLLKASHATTLSPQLTPGLFSGPHPAAFPFICL